MKIIEHVTKLQEILFLSNTFLTVHILSQCVLRMYKQSKMRHSYSIIIKFL